MDPQVLIQQAKDLAAQSQTLAERAAELANQTQLLGVGMPSSRTSATVLLTLFLLACFLGWHLAKGAAKERHALLGGLALVLSSVLALGAVAASGLGGLPMAKIFSIVALALASEAIFGGLFAAHRLTCETVEPASAPQESPEEIKDGEVLP